MSDDILRIECYPRSIPFPIIAVVVLLIGGICAYYYWSIWVLAAAVVIAWKIFLLGPGHWSRYRYVLRGDELLIECSNPPSQVLVKMKELRGYKPEENGVWFEARGQRYFVPEYWHVNSSALYGELFRQIPGAEVMGMNYEEAKEFREDLQAFEQKHKWLIIAGIVAVIILSILMFKLNMGCEYSGSP